MDDERQCERCRDSAAPDDDYCQKHGRWATRRAWVMLILLFGGAILCLAIGSQAFGAPPRDLARRVRAGLEDVTVHQILTTTQARVATSRTYLGAQLKSSEQQVTLLRPWAFTKTTQVVTSPGRFPVPPRVEKRTVTDTVYVKSWPALRGKVARATLRYNHSRRAWIVAEHWHHSVRTPLIVTRVTSGPLTTQTQELNLPYSHGPGMNGTTAALDASYDVSQPDWLQDWLAELPAIEVDGVKLEKRTIGGYLAVTQ